MESRLVWQSLAKSEKTHQNKQSGILKQLNATNIAVQQKLIQDLTKSGL